MAISSKSNTSGKFQVRSISFPCRSHPTTIRIEQELNNLKTWEASHVLTGKGICDGLTCLTRVYRCVDELFGLPTAQQALCRHQDGKWVEGLLNESVSLLDICGSTRDMVVQIKDHVRDLQYALRRRKGDLSIESNIAKYTSLIKKIKKDVKKMVANLKQNESTNFQSLESEHDDLLVSIIRVLIEVSKMTFSVLVSILLFFSVKPKSSRCSIVSRLVQTKRVACLEHHENMVNDLESLDIALLALCKDGSSEKEEKSQIAKKRLEAMEAQMEAIDSGLECIFRGLIRSRSLLLNVVSQ